MSIIDKLLLGFLIIISSCCLGVGFYMKGYNEYRKQDHCIETIRNYKYSSQRFKFLFERINIENRVIKNSLRGAGIVVIDYANGEVIIKP